MLKRLLSAVFIAVASLSPAAAQWQVPEFAVPSGRGAGRTGFEAIGPCLAGVPIVGAGISAKAACHGSALGTIASQSAANVAITGGTLTGVTITNPIAITGLPAPVNPADAARKADVDAASGAQQDKASANLATAAMLPNTPTYDNGTAGVGATLTAGANAALVVDGVTVSLGWRIAVKDEVTAAHRGIYTVTTVGSGAAAWVLTRTTDADTGAELTGARIFVTAGTTNTNTQWSQIATVATVGTDTVTFTQSGGTASFWQAHGSDIAPTNAGGVCIGAGCTNVTGSTKLEVRGDFRLYENDYGIGRIDSSTRKVTGSLDYLRSTIYIANYVTSLDGTSDNTALVQAAYDACASLSGVAGTKGCVVQWPVGRIRINGAITISHGVYTKCANPGWHNLPGGSPAADQGGTTIEQASTTSNTFTVTTLDPVTFEGCGFNGSCSATSGSWVYIKPEATPAANPNRGSKFINNFVVCGYDVFTCELCGNYSIISNKMYGPRGTPVKLLNSTTLADNGDATIFDNTIGPYGGAVPAGHCIDMSTQGGVRIISNKLLGCVSGVYINALQGVTGGIQIALNNIEEMVTNFIRIDRSSGSGQQGQIIIADNHMQNNVTNTFQGGIVVTAGTGLYLNYVKIHGNQINFGAPAPVTTAQCMAISNGSNVTIFNNFCNMNATAGYSGIEIAGSNTTNIRIWSNVVINPGAGLLPYRLHSPATAQVDIRDPGITVSQLISMVGGGLRGGSIIYVTDGKANNINTNDHSLASGGTGCVAMASSTSTFFCIGP